MTRPQPHNDSSLRDDRHGDGRPVPRPRPRPRPRLEGGDPGPDEPHGPTGNVPSGSWAGPAAPRVLYAAPDLHDPDGVRAGGDARTGGEGGVLAEVPGPDSVARHRVPADRQASGGIHDRVRAALGELRFVRERPSSLVDHLAYARYGEWTTQDDGQRRSAAVMWAYLVAIPVTAVAHFAVWAVARPTRAAVVTVIAAVLATALNQIPVVERLVPDWASLTAWPPFSWF